jgi:hypothetical protein
MFGREAASADEERQRQNLSWVAIWLALGTALGLIVVVCVTGWECPVALAWALACLVTGGLVGFLFGIPKEVQGDSASIARRAGAVALATAPNPSPVTLYEQRVNTNIEQVSDWLTKIIVGLGLVELRKIPEHLKSVTDFLAHGYGTDDCKAFVECPAFGGAITVYFVVVGFFGGYLLTRLFLAPAFDVLGRLSQLRREVNKAVSANRLLRQGRQATTVQRITPDVISSDDPQKGRWGAQAGANGRRLSATVTPVPTAPEWFHVQLEVTSTDNNRPLAGDVIFHLHPTFDPSDRTVSVQNNMALLEIDAYGAFTVGAEADNGQTRLELDLATLPDAPASFRQR